MRISKKTPWLHSWLQNRLAKRCISKYPLCQFPYFKSKKCRWVLARSDWSAQPINDYRSPFPVSNQERTHEKNLFDSTLLSTIREPRDPCPDTGYRLLPVEPLIYTVGTLTEYDDDNSVAVNFVDQFNGITYIWFPKTETANLSLILMAKTAKFKVALAWDAAAASTKSYPKDPPTFSAYRLKKLRIL
jgi:hypothetical protein